MAISRRLNDLPEAAGGAFVYAEAKNGQQIRVPLVSGGNVPKMTSSEYYNLLNNGKIENKVYAIYKDDVLQSVYIGSTMVMRKAREGEQITFGGVFPLVFPIIFP